jgi:GNAT superfamily N-acetyltransferase
MSGFVVSDDKGRLDVALIHRFLSEQSSWAIGIPRELVERGIANSLCFGGYLDGRQVAFARVITDCATFAYLVDVFVLPEHRSRGYSLQIMDAVMSHPSQGSLVIIGGGLRADNADVWQKIVQLAGGKGARIAVFPSAAGNPSPT